MFNVLSMLTSYVLCYTSFVYSLTTYVSQNTRTWAPPMQSCWKQRKDPVCDGSDIDKRCLDALSYTFQHPSSGVSVRSVHAAQRVPESVRFSCPYVNDVTVIKGWHCEGPLPEALPCYFPLVSPCPQRGGWFCDLPPTHTRGRQPPHKSVRKGVAEVIHPSAPSPSKAYPPPAVLHSS